MPIGKVMVILMFFIVRFDDPCQAQFKSKAAKQQAKPSKEVTLNYIRDKIQKYAIEYKKSYFTDVTFFSDGTRRHTFEDWYISGYHMIETGNRLSLVATCKYNTFTNESGNVSDKEDNHWKTVAPFDQLKSIKICKPYEHSANGYPRESSACKIEKYVTYYNSYLELTFSSNCVDNRLEDNSHEYQDFYIIAFREGEENLLINLVKAFKNLQTYYPRQVNQDPFSN